MSRFLFVVPPFHGHINPVAGVAAELTARGHDVAWVGDEELLAKLAPGSTVFGVPCPIAVRPPEVRGFAAWKHLWEATLIPLAHAMLPGVHDAVETWRPDALVVDQQAFAGALAAQKLGLPWATSATTSSELTDPLATMPTVAQWVRDLLTDLRKNFGDPDAEHDLRFSPHLVLAFTSEALVGEHTADAPVRFVGQAGRPAPDVDFPWDWLDGRPLALISLGTANADAGERFLAECATAMGERPELQAVIVDRSRTLTDVPDNVLVLAEIPQLKVLDRTDVVLCHGGHNTVCEALDRAIPLVVAPIRDDQPVIAEQVLAAGAGVRLRFTHAKAAQIGQAIDAVRAEPGYRAAAKAIQESFAAAGGAPAAADSLEHLIKTGTREFSPPVTLR